MYFHANMAYAKDFSKASAILFDRRTSYTNFITKEILIA